jgi:hypothetical protein
MCGKAKVGRECVARRRSKSAGMRRTLLALPAQELEDVRADLEGWYGSTAKSSGLRRRTLA